MVDFTRIPFHMPGHKRNTELFAAESGVTLPYELDITEIDGADDLHDMCGDLAELSSLAARLYGARSAFPMVNGSTGGILAAIATVSDGGDTIIMSREAHKSAYNAVEMCGLTPVYLDEVTPAAVADALDLHLNCACVFVTSPTYLGSVADIEGLAHVAHAKNIPLVVDAAHGAHLGFSKAFPRNASRLGADIEIVSLHKTLPSLTQTALALVSGDLVVAKELELRLRVFETSSPSYVLLASIERCLHLLESQGAALFAQYEARLHLFYERTRLTPAGDIGKIVIPAESGGGRRLMQRFREEFNIELEMCGVDYALAMTSIADTDAAFDALAAAVIATKTTVHCNSLTPKYHVPERHCTPIEARRQTGEVVLYREAVGRVTREYAWAYPPGVPLLVPGEVIDLQVVAQLDALKAAGIEPHSDYGELPGVSVVE